MGHGNPGGRYILKSRTREEKLAVPVCKGSDPPLISTGVFSLISVRGVAICKLFQGNQYNSSAFVIVCSLHSRLVGCEMEAEKHLNICLSIIDVRSKFKNNLHLIRSYTTQSQESQSLKICVSLCAFFQEVCVTHTMHILCVSIRTMGSVSWSHIHVP